MSTTPPAPPSVDPVTKLLSHDEAFLESYRRLCEYAGADIISYMRELEDEQVEASPSRLTGGSASTLPNPAEYLSRRSALLRSLLTTSPSSSRFSSEESDSDYASRRRDLLTRKFDVYANNADTVLMKQQARAALRRAVKAENDLIRREELIVSNKLQEKEFEGELFVKLKSTLHLPSGITSMNLLSRSSDLCCVTTGKNISLVNLHSGKVIDVVEDAHNDSIIGAGFSSRNNLVVTISLDKTARVWIVSDKLLSSDLTLGKKPEGGCLTLCSLIPFKGMPTIILFPLATSDIGVGSEDESVFVVCENVEGKGYLHAVEAMRGRMLKSVDLGKSLTSSSISSSLMAMKSKKVTVTSACFKLDAKVIYLSLSDRALISVPFVCGSVDDPALILGKISKVSTGGMVKGMLKSGMKTTQELKRMVKKRNSFGGSSSFGGGSPDSTGGKNHGDDDGEEQKVEVPSFKQMCYRTYDTKLKNPSIIGMTMTALNVAMIRVSGKMGKVAPGEAIILEEKLNPFLPNSEQNQTCLSLHPFDNLIVTGSKSGGISVLDPHGEVGNVVVCKVEGMHGGEVKFVEWSYDCGTLVSGDVNGDVVIWQVGREEKVKVDEDEGLMRGWNK
ncbi:hypothetical protein TL16_g11991 [Triparma laevis f. inornata]|uniref:Uncharacterized protein n=1 Tax=Triparma laevis f. inornata TaxID=1714386 RepID=A0A9W7BR97_9STRA|nr:hypothetical protein TL16_g11991 [Triparma laevis f. inornata]